MNNYEWLKSHINYLNTHYKITDFVIEWIEKLPQYTFAKQLEKDFPNFTFWYQWFLFKENNSI
jgi:hypothetical protein